jgi:phosphopantothenoylcysteine decarboxylase/phosphopantothenate--cysteine ligase
VKVGLGVTGCIAAYKAVDVMRGLQKAGLEVQVVLTPSAHDFVSPLVLSTLSHRPALTTLVEQVNGTALWNDHVHLARWADLLLIAPATAETLAKMAHGLCDNLLMACWLSAPCPVYVAPAMDLETFRHPAVKANLALLAKRNVGLIGPETGELASGLVGEGRMPEPADRSLFDDFFPCGRCVLTRQNSVPADGNQSEPPPLSFCTDYDM